MGISVRRNPYRPTRILVVDDNHNLTRLLAAALRKWGYQVFCAYDGKEGYVKAKSLAPELVVLNYLMPHMTGTEVLERLRRDERTKDMKAIITSANPLAKREAYLAGAEDFVHLPYLMRDWRGTIERTLPPSFKYKDDVHSPMGTLLRLLEADAILALPPGETDHFMAAILFHFSSSDRKETVDWEHTPLNEALVSFAETPEFFELTRLELDARVEIIVRRYSKGKDPSA